LKTAFASGIASGLIVICLYVVGLVVLNHVFLSYQQGSGQLCPKVDDKAFARKTQDATQRTVSPFPFRPSERCHASGLRVVKGTPYRLEIAATEPFEETGRTVALPGLGDDFDWRAVIFWPFRRWWTAQWWQPIARIQPEGTEEWALSPVKGGAASLVGMKPGDVFAAEFTASADGEIFLFVNDALGAIPLRGLLEGAYANNKGLATLTLTPIEYALPIPK
jgi:hypothetical protein